jgi:hypothetical protein
MTEQGRHQRGFLGQDTGVEATKVLLSASLAREGAGPKADLFPLHSFRLDVPEGPLSLSVELPGRSPLELPAVTRSGSVTVRLEAGPP